MISLNTPVMPYAAPIPAAAVELRRESVQAPVIPESAPTAAGEGSRATADAFEQALRGNESALVARGDRRPVEENRGVDVAAKASEAPSTEGAEPSSETPPREDNGTTDDSRGEGRERARDAQLSQAEENLLRQLRATDRNVRAHEAAHAAVGGQYAGAPSYQYHQGPDGKPYAVGGEVAIDLTGVPGDADATIRKMRQVMAAALAPADPSGQDRRVAARAQAAIAAARAVLAEQGTQGPVSVRRMSLQDAGPASETAKTETAAASFSETARSARAATGELTVYAEPLLRSPCPLCSKPHLTPPEVSVRLLRTVDMQSRLQGLGVVVRESEPFRASA